jgi:hypothetical protein
MSAIVRADEKLNGVFLKLEDGFGPLPGLGYDFLTKTTFPPDKVAV